MPESQLAALKRCAEYIYDTEREDYYRWCDEERQDSNNIEHNKHIFCDALLAMGYTNESWLNA